MAITGTDHTVLLVADIDAAIANWQDKLGLPLAHRAKPCTNVLMQPLPNPFVHPNNSTACDNGWPK